MEAESLAAVGMAVAIAIFALFAVVEDLFGLPDFCLPAISLPAISLPSVSWFCSAVKANELANAAADAVTAATIPVFVAEVKYLTTANVVLSNHLGQVEANHAATLEQMQANHAAEIARMTANFTNQNRALQLELDAVMAELGKSQAVAKNLAADKANLAGNINNLQAVNNKRQMEVKQLQDRLPRAEAEAKKAKDAANLSQKTMKESLSKVRTEKTELEQKLATLESTNKQQGNEKAALEKKLADAEATKTQQDNEKAALEARLTDVEAAKAGLEAEKVKLVNALEPRRKTRGRKKKVAAVSDGEQEAEKEEEKKTEEEVEETEEENED